MKAIILMSLMFSGIFHVQTAFASCTATPIYSATGTYRGCTVVMNGFAATHLGPNAAWCTAMCTDALNDDADSKDPKILPASYSTDEDAPQVSR